jgi:hypothetical protein
MQHLQHRLRVGLGDAKERSGGAFGAAVSLFPVLERAGTDADERGKLNLAETEFFAHGFGVGPLQGGAARGFLFPTQDGTTLLETDDKLFEEEFVFHGNSVSMMVSRTLS